MSDAPKDHRRQDILAYKQGFLTAEEAAELEEHLRGCTACQATLEKVTRFLPALQQALTPELVSDGEMLARVKAQLREREERRPAGFFSRMRVALLAGAAAGAGAIALVVQLLVRQPEVGLVGAPRPPPGYQRDAGPDAGRR